MKSREIVSGEGDSGINVTYIKSKRLLEISGWYDGFVGIAPYEIPLRDFLKELGISLKDVENELNPDKEK
jgi:hypothetical protein